MMITDRNQLWPKKTVEERPYIQVMLVYSRSAANLYVRWKMSQARMRMVASYLGADERVIRQGLRLYDATDAAYRQTIRDFPIAESNDSVSTHEILEIEEGRIYIVDYGLFAQGRFYPVMRSEPITLISS